MGNDPERTGRKKGTALQKAENLWGALLEPKERDGCSWRWADSDDLRDAVVAATEDGAAVLLSKTSDGGALVVQVWSGADRFKLYPASAEEIAVVLMHIKSIGMGANNGR